jgi:hypothetical protein
MSAEVVAFIKFIQQVRFIALEHQRASGAVGWRHEIECYDLGEIGVEAWVELDSTGATRVSRVRVTVQDGGWRVESGVEVVNDITGDTEAVYEPEGVRTLSIHEAIPVALQHWRAALHYQGDLVAKQSGVGSSQ